MPKYAKQKCIHCLTYYDKLTEDHIFPRAWYPDSSPLNMEKWTAPSCLSCNEKLGSAEADIFNRLAICSDENDLAASGINKKCLDKMFVMTAKDPRELGSRSKFLIDTIKEFVPYRYEEGNQQTLKGCTPKEGVRGTLMIRIPLDELYTVAEKIIRGLEFHLRGRLIEKDKKIEIIIPCEHNKKEIELTGKWQSLISPIKQNIQRGPGFIVEYGVNLKNSDWVIYHVTIWNQVEIWAMVHPQK